eukprot:TRINITY_DN1697_c1_g1_i1.p1 TRINITY_DN1697_c1_g1~~TRINITY_DN1697_c1_g1_i1.p1  ORF type:complete len:315 (-),score=82.75 TRINITY_DN1697_c1_g1_i1:6-950(-)
MFIFQKYNKNKRQYISPKMYDKRKGKSNKLLNITIIILFSILILAIYFYLTSSGNEHTLKPVGVGGNDNDDKDSTSRALILHENYFELPPVHKNEEYSLYFAKGGYGSENLFILVHGKERAENSKHWRGSYETLNSLGTFYSLDMVLHGKAVPGENDKQLRHISDEEYSDHLIYFTNYISDEHRIIDYVDRNKNVILIGRDWGAKIIFDSLKSLQDIVKGIVLVTPKIKQSDLENVPERIFDIPLLLVWGKDDVINQFNNRMPILNNFRKVTVLFFENTVPLGVSASLTNKPAAMNPEEFNKSVLDFCENLDLT